MRNSRLEVTDKPDASRLPRTSTLISLQFPFWLAPRLRRTGFCRAHLRFAVTAPAIGADAHWPLGTRAFPRLSRAVPMICLGWPRPFLVAAALIPAASLLEALQCLRPDHSPNILAALSSIGGIGVGALIAVVMIRALERQACNRTIVGPTARSNPTAEG